MKLPSRLLKKSRMTALQERIRGPNRNRSENETESSARKQWSKILFQQPARPALQLPRGTQLQCLSRHQHFCCGERRGPPNHAVAQPGRPRRVRQRPLADSAGCIATGAKPPRPSNAAGSPGHSGLPTRLASYGRSVSLPQILRTADISRRFNGIGVRSANSRRRHGSTGSWLPHRCLAATATLGDRACMPSLAVSPN